MIRSTAELEHIPEAEAVLARMITPNPRDKGEAQDNLHLDWYRLLKWDEACNCRLTVTALLTCIIGEQDNRMGLLYANRAKRIFFISRQNGQDGLFWACALYLATLSTEESERVKSKFLQLYEINCPDAVPNLLGKICMSQRPSFADIARELGCPNYKHLPPPNRPELFSACRRVMADLLPTSRVRLATDFFESEVIDLSEMPHLSRAVVETAAREEALGLQKLIFSDLETIADGLLLALTPGLPHYLKFGYTAQAKMFDDLLSLAKMLPIDDGTQPIPGRLVIGLLQHPGYPWIVAIADRLAVQIANHYDSEENWQTLTNFILDCCKRDQGVSGAFKEAFDSLQNPENRENLARHMNEASCGLSRVCEVMPDAWKVSIRAGLPQQSSHDCIGLVGGFGSAMAREPELTQQKIGPLVEKGTVETSLVLAYLEAVGPENGADNLSAWIAKLHTPQRASHLSAPTPYHGMQELIEYICKHRLAAGKLLYMYPETFREYEYELKPEDIANPRQVQMLFDYGVQDNLLTPIWKSPSWTTALLGCQHNQKLLVRSLLRSLSTNWVREWSLDPEDDKESDVAVQVAACFEQDHILFKFAWKIAWNPQTDENSVKMAKAAQNLLWHCQRGLPVWDYREGKVQLAASALVRLDQTMLNCMKRYLKLRGCGLSIRTPNAYPPKQKTSLADLVMTPAYQRHLVLRELVGNYKPHHNSVEYWGHLFHCTSYTDPDMWPDSFKQLLSCLEDNRRTMHPECWCCWAEASRAYEHSQQIRDRLEEIRDIQDSYGNIAHRALSMLIKHLQLTDPGTVRDLEDTLNIRIE